MEKLELDNVEITYAGVILVVRGVSLEVNKGQIVTLLGANGAGKSTLLKGISGLLKLEEGKITAGSVMFDGRRIENHDPQEISKLGIIQVMEGRRILEHLTIDQNLLCGSHNDHANAKTNFEMVFDLFPKLKDLRNQRGGYISGGEQQMVVFGRALMASPELLMLDEPSLGLAPLVTKEIYDVIKQINQERKLSILVVEQNARVALDSAQYGYVMENGRIVLDGSAEKLRANEDIKEFYLGLSELGGVKRYKDIKHYKRRKRWL